MVHGRVLRLCRLVMEGIRCFRIEVGLLDEQRVGVVLPVLYYMLEIATPDVLVVLWSWCGRYVKLMGVLGIKVGFKCRMLI